MAAGLGLASACGGRAESDDVGASGQGASPGREDSDRNAPPPFQGTPAPNMPAPAELRPPQGNEVCYHPSALANLGIPTQVLNEPGLLDGNGCLSGDYSGWLNTGQDCTYDANGAVLREGGQCCYVMANSIPACGRPLVVNDGTRRVAALPELDATAESARADTVAIAIAREWLNDALLEHASIASFSFFGLSLMAIGAPLELVAECQRAVQDEVEHARACFALAARYGAEHRAPGPLDVSGIQISTDLAEIALRTLVDSCVEETIAALTARAQLDVVTDVQVRGTLERIAEDELRHAELGWKFMAWALSSDARISSVVRDVRASLAVRSSAARAEQPSVELERWHAAGRLAPHEQQLIRERALELLIRPALDALVERAPIYSAGNHGSPSQPPSSNRRPHAHGSGSSQSTGAPAMTRYVPQGGVTGPALIASAATNSPLDASNAMPGPDLSRS